MKAELGDVHTKAILTLFIIDAIKFFNVGKSMSDEQVAQTIILIQDDYWMLKPEDFKLCFDNAKKGKYGKVYDRIDGQVILEWLHNYLLARLDFSEQRSIRIAQERNAGMHQERLQHDQDKKDRAIEEHNNKVSYYIEQLKKQQQ